MLLRHDVVNKVFCFDLVQLRYLTLEEETWTLDLSIVHNLTILFYLIIDSCVTQDSTITSDIRGKHHKVNVLKTFF